MAVRSREIANLVAEDGANVRQRLVTGERVVAQHVLGHRLCNV